MPDGQPTRTEHKIRSFLAEYRDADLVVCTGYTSVNGLAWLARQVNKHQQVTLVIGDMTANRFTKATEADRAAASAFLRGRNVTVHNWYRTRPVKKTAHGKTVVAQRDGRTLAVLVGSANLTETGLSNNLEIMVRCHPDDWSDIEAYVEEATRHPPANDKLIGFVGSDRALPAAEQVPAAGGSGCLSALAMIPVHIVGSLWNRLRFRIHL